MFSVHYIVLRGFYAMEDTRTPFFIQCVIARGQHRLGHHVDDDSSSRSSVAPALALAYGASYLVGALDLARTCCRTAWAVCGRSACSSSSAGSRQRPSGCRAAWLRRLGLLEAAGLTSRSKADSLVLLTVGAVVGLAVYIVMARLLRITEICPRGVRGHARGHGASAA